MRRLEEGVVAVLRRSRERLAGDERAGAVGVDRRELAPGRGRGELGALDLAVEVDEGLALRDDLTRLEVDARHDAGSVFAIGRAR